MSMYTSLSECKSAISKLERDKAFIDYELRLARIAEDEFRSNLIDNLDVFDWGIDELQQHKKSGDTDQSIPTDIPDGVTVDNNTTEVSTLPIVDDCNDSQLSNSTQSVEPASSVQSTSRQKEKTFDLHINGDVSNGMNIVHSFICQEILEGFIVSGDTLYSNTVGFRCKWCKWKDRSDRSKRSSVHPRSIGGIYRSIIRFQRDHIM